MIGGRTDNAVKNRYHALKLKRRTKSLTRVDSTQSKDTVRSKSMFVRDGTAELGQEVS